MEKSRKHYHRGFEQHGKPKSKHRRNAVWLAAAVVVLIMLLLLWVNVADILGWGDGAA